MNQMVDKLEKNHHKHPSYKDMSQVDLNAKLDEEYVEVLAALEEAVFDPSPENRKRLIMEAADLANICMFVAYTAGQLDHDSLA